MSLLTRYADIADKKRVTFAELLGRGVAVVELGERPFVAKERLLLPPFAFLVFLRRTGTAIVKKREKQSFSKSIAVE